MRSEDYLTVAERRALIKELRSISDDINGYDFDHDSHGEDHGPDMIGLMVWFCLGFGCGLTFGSLATWWWL